MLDFYHFLNKAFSTIRRLFTYFNFIITSLAIHVRLVEKNRRYSCYNEIIKLLVLCNNHNKKKSCKLKLLLIEKRRGVSYTLLVIRRDGDAKVVFRVWPA